MYCDIYLCDVCIDFHLQKNLLKSIFLTGCELQPLFQCVQLKCKSAFKLHFSFWCYGSYFSVWSFANIEKNRRGNFELNCFDSIFPLNYLYNVMWCTKTTQNLHSSSVIRFLLTLCLLSDTRSSTNCQKFTGGNTFNFSRLNLTGCVCVCVCQSGERADRKSRASLHVMWVSEFHKQSNFRQRRRFHFFFSTRYFL